MMKDAEMNQTCIHENVTHSTTKIPGIRTPKRVALDGESSRNLPSRSIGDHTGSPPYIATDEDDTMIPTKLTSENVSGTEISCGRNAAAGVFARDAKSGAFLETNSF